MLGESAESGNSPSWPGLACNIEVRETGTCSSDSTARQGVDIGALFNAQIEVLDSLGT